MNAPRSGKHRARPAVSDEASYRHGTLVERRRLRLQFLGRYAADVAALAARAAPGSPETAEHAGTVGLLSALESYDGAGEFWPFAVPYVEAAIRARATTDKAVA